MRVVFMGTPAFSVPALQAIHAAGHEIIQVYTRPPAPAGRGMKLKPSPVHEVANALGLTVSCPENFKTAETVDEFTARDCDLAVVVAYGLILPRALLQAPGRGCWNIHASLLPRWRGAAPIQRAIMAGDEKTGVAIMQMAVVEFMDAMRGDKKVLSGRVRFVLLESLGQACITVDLDQSEIAANL